jgi:hypothetical protein
MLRIKKLDQLSKINEADTETVKVSQISPRDGEISRWRIKYKGSIGNILDPQTASTILDYLVSAENFKNWWNYAKIPNKYTPNRVTDLSVNTSICCIEMIKSKTGGLGSDKISIEVSFLPYISTIPNTEPAESSKTGAILNYDISKIRPIVKDIAVKNSGVQLAVWNYSDLEKMKAGQAIVAKYPNGTGIDIDKVSPDFILDNVISKQSSVINPQSQSQPPQSSTTSNADQGSSQPTANIPYLIDYSNITINVKNSEDRVKVLQNAIMAYGKANPTNQTAKTAASYIQSSGGADGKYGQKTAYAVGILLDKSASLQTITKSDSDKLNELFKDLSIETYTAIANTKVTTHKNTKSVKSTGDDGDSKPLPRP